VQKPQRICRFRAESAAQATESAAADGVRGQVGQEPLQIKLANLRGVLTAPQLEAIDRPPVDVDDCDQLLPAYLGRAGRSLIRPCPCWNAVAAMQAV